MALLGRGSDEHIGSSAFDLYRDFPEVLESVRRALAGETVHPILDLGGPVLEVWASPVRDGDGKVTGVIGVGIDVTERHRMQEQMQQQARLAAVGQLAGGIAHDFNNFLMTIIFYAHLLLRVKNEADDIASVAETIMGEARRAAALVRQVLELGGLIASFMLAILFSGWLAETLQEHTSLPYSPSLIISFVVLFIAGLVAIHFIATAVQKLVRMMFLGWFITG